jgi:hypothetical protein
MSTMLAQPNCMSPLGNVPYFYMSYIILIYLSLHHIHHLCVESWLHRNGKGFVCMVWSRSDVNFWIYFLLQFIFSRIKAAWPTQNEQKKKEQGKMFVSKYHKATLEVFSNVGWVNLLS